MLLFRMHTSLTSLYSRFINNSIPSSINIDTIVQSLDPRRWWQTDCFYLVRVEYYLRAVFAWAELCITT